MKTNFSFLFFLTISLLSSFSIFSQMQLGSDIDGENTGDGFGFSISLSPDGKRVAIGAPDSEQNKGYVKVFEWNDSTWIQLGNVISGLEENDHFGYSISLSSDGNRLAIGAPKIGDFSPGFAQVYEWNGTDWIQIGKNISRGFSADLFGFSVSLSSNGNRIAVGAPSDDGNGTDSGRVTIFEWNGVSWSALAFSSISGEAEDDQSGYAVSLSDDGSQVAIGAPFHTSNIFSEGQVRVMEWSGSSWGQVGIDIDGDEIGYASGSAVALSSDGNRVAIGIGNVAGILEPVRVFEWQAEKWTQVGTDIFGESIDTHSGYSISLSSNGSRVAIGAPFNDENGNNAGLVRVHEWEGEAWEQIGSAIPGEAEGDVSGIAVSLSSDGNRVAVGAPGNNENGEDSGQVRIFEFSTVSTQKQYSAHKIKVFPNPTTGKIRIWANEFESINILNQFGKTVWATQKFVSEIDISHFSNGLYYLHIQSDNGWQLRNSLRSNR